MAKISNITALGHQTSIRAFGYETRKFQFSQVDDELLACVVRFVTSNQRAGSGAVYSQMDIFMLTRRRAHIDGGHYQVSEAIHCTDLVRFNELDQHLRFHSLYFADTLMKFQLKFKIGIAHFEGQTFDTINVFLQERIR